MVARPGGSLAVFTTEFVGCYSKSSASTTMPPRLTFSTGTGKSDRLGTGGQPLVPVTWWAGALGYVSHPTGSGPHPGPANMARPLVQLHKSQHGIGQVICPVRFLAIKNLPARRRSTTVGSSFHGRRNVGTSAVSGSSFSTPKAPGVFLERAAMEDFLQNPRVGGFDKPSTHSTGGRRHGRCSQPTTTGIHAPLRCARHDLGTLQQSTARNVDIKTRDI
jgi:hypothetical protein